MRIDAFFMSDILFLSLFCVSFSRYLEYICASETLLFKAKKMLSFNIHV